MDKLLLDKVAIVTGGASGIGRATALAFAREGAKVAIADLNVEGGEQTVAAIREIGGDALFIETDMSKGGDIKAMVEATVAHFGKLDIAFNNAGYPGTWTNAVDCGEEEWDTAVNINLKGVWLCMKYQIPHMIAAGGGAIVNTASGAGVVAVPGMVSYVATKHGVVGLTKSAAIDFAAQNIRVNALLPGPTLTPMMAKGFKGLNQSPEQTAQILPIKRIGTVDEQADAVVWLCSERSSFVVGVALPVDGGLVAM